MASPDARAGDGQTQHPAGLAVALPAHQVRLVPYGRFTRLGCANDRFLLCTRLGYLPPDKEAAMLRQQLDQSGHQPELRTLTSGQRLLGLRESLNQVHIADDLLGYVVRLLTAIREHPQVTVGASPRGGIAITRLSRGQALLDGRDYVTPEDVKSVAVPALSHRLVLRPELWVRRVTSDEIVTELLAEVPTPPTRAQVAAEPAHD
jgi:MoxR-like ATPase